MSESFSSVISDIKNNICKHGVYSPYVRFVVLDTVFGDVEFTTNDADSCMITSFENNKNGSGQANTFSLTLAFSPSKLFYKGNSNLDYSDVNLIDKILNFKSIYSNYTGFTKCTIEYGYSYPIKLITKQYEGYIVDYTTEMSNATLIYTLTGYSGLSIEYKDLMVTIEGAAEGEESIKKKPTTIIQEVYDKYLSDSGYELVWADDTKDTDIEIEVETAQNISIFQYMKTILDSATYSEDTDETPELEKCKYYMNISDEKDNKHIYIERYDPKSKQINANNAETVRFSWLGSSSSEVRYSSDAIVIDFKTDFKGSVSMSYNYSKAMKKYVRSGIDSSGNIIRSKSNNMPTAGGNTENDSAISLNLWASRLQYMYTATLVTIGIPYEMKLLDNIYIAPMILGQEHHTGGLYKITKIRDVIDGSGFTTTFELARNQAPSEDGYETQIGRKSIISPEIKQNAKDKIIQHIGSEGVD